jgi:hypothetical protein
VIMAKGPAEEKLLSEWWITVEQGWRGCNTEHRYDAPRDKRPSLHIWVTETHEYTATFDALDEDGRFVSNRPPGERRWFQLPDEMRRPSFIKVLDRPSTVWMGEAEERLPKGRK